MGTRMNNKINNNINWMIMSRRVNNKGIDNIRMVRPNHLVYHLNSVTSIHNIKFRKEGGSNTFKFERDDKKRKKWTSGWDNKLWISSLEKVTLRPLRTK